MKYYDKRTGIYISESEEDPLKDAGASLSEIKDALSGYILSASGWRCIFASSKDEKDSTESVKDADKIITALSAKAFYTYLGKKRAKIITACDSRPTGRVLLSIVTRILGALGAEVSMLSIASAPEVMAYSNSSFDGFFFITASHNPIGYNGFKFGKSGGVLDKGEETLVEELLLSSIKGDPAKEMRELSASLSREKYDKILRAQDEEKMKALSYYSDFVEKTEKIDSTFTIPFGIVIDFNGSARAASIDKAFLKKHKARLLTINEDAGKVVHGIVPEGDNLETVRKALEEANRKDKSFILGLMPDNDGDRGNIVYMSAGRAEIINAQTVFALVAAIELSDARIKEKDKKIAIAVNGPTSLLIDEIARALNVEVFRSDVGEANVVNLAERLRQKGYIVPVAGEGSNGGNITHPSKVRDPMDSVISIAKLYSNKDLYSYLVNALGKKAEDVSIDALLSAFPGYYTTSAFSSEATLKADSDYAELKKEFEKILLSEIDENMPQNATSYEIREYEGEVEKIRKDYNTPFLSGGYKVQFCDKEGNAIAYIWLSHSRTEPVCRLIADVKEKKEEYSRLFSWLHSMVRRADKSLC